VAICHDYVDFYAAFGDVFQNVEDYRGSTVEKDSQTLSEVILRKLVDNSQLVGSMVCQLDAFNLDLLFYVVHACFNVDFDCHPLVNITQRTQTQTTSIIRHVLQPNLLDELFHAELQILLK